MCSVQRTLDLLHLHRLRCSACASTTVHHHHRAPSPTSVWSGLRCAYSWEVGSNNPLASEICSSAYIHEQPCRSLSLLSLWRSCIVVAVSLCRRGILLLGVVDYRSSKGSIFGVSFPPTFVDTACLACLACLAFRHVLANSGAMRAHLSRSFNLLVR